MRQALRGACHHHGGKRGAHLPAPGVETVKGRSMQETSTKTSFTYHASVSRHQTPTAHGPAARDLPQPSPAPRPHVVLGPAPASPRGAPWV